MSKERLRQIRQEQELWANKDIDAILQIQQDKGLLGREIELHEGISTDVLSLRLLGREDYEK